MTLTDIVKEKEARRITNSVTIQNYLEPSKVITCVALVDSRVLLMVLPTDYKDKLGKLNTIREMEFDLTNQERIHGEVCGPVRIQLEGFVPTYSEVLFC